MYYKTDFSIDTFDFWAGAYDRVRDATPDQLEQVAWRIEDVFDGTVPTDTDINDLVWFECDDIFFPEDDED